MPVRWILLLLGVLATPLCWIAGAFMSGGGHSYAAMIIYFPWAMLLDLSFEGLPWWAVIAPVFAAQYPLYGFLFGYSIERRKVAPALTALAAAHLAAVAICFMIDPKSSWKVFA